MDTRILVPTAAYELPVLQRAIGESALCGATHIAFTTSTRFSTGHLRECTFEAGPKPLFSARGQNISGSLFDSVFSMLVEKTLGIGQADSRADGS